LSRHLRHKRTGLKLVWLVDRYRSWLRPDIVAASRDRCIRAPSSLQILLSNIARMEAGKAGYQSVTLALGKF